MNDSGYTDSNEPTCPQCKELPRHRQPSGRLDAYCKPCRVKTGSKSLGYVAAERECERCHVSYRGNSRAKAQICPDCRTSCVTCGQTKSPRDTHSECGDCRSAGKTCDSCGVNPTHQNRKQCWTCITEDGTYAATVRNRMYGLLPGQYERMLERQHGVCAICGQPERSRHAATDKLYPLATDHDRACCSGNRSCGSCVRELICRPCNVMLGMAKDNPAILRMAAKYLDRWHKNYSHTNAKTPPERGSHVSSS